MDNKSGQAKDNQQQPQQAAAQQPQQAAAQQPQQQAKPEDPKAKASCRSVNFSEETRPSAGKNKGATDGK
jgi:hypothetical protein